MTLDDQSIISPVTTDTATEQWGEGSADRPHCIKLARDGWIGKLPAYTVTFRDAQLGRWRDPEFCACRALLARGIVGHLETRWAGSAHASMRLDIANGAKLATQESNRVSVRTVAYKPIDPSQFKPNRYPDDE
jgi:hypothetical protein